MSIKPATALGVSVRAVYRHFEGGLIQVVKIVKHSHTDEELVLYSVINEPTQWEVLPVADFTGTVEDKGISKPRFALTEIAISTIGGMLVAR